MNVIEILQSSTLYLILSLIVILLLGILAGRIFQNIKDKKNIKKQRNDAVKRSRAVLGGQFGEQLAPFFPDFPCNPGDVKFIGRPVDYVAFPGSAEGQDVNEVVFIEVKSGVSKLSEREKQIKNAIENGRVRYVVYTLPQN